MAQAQLVTLRKKDNSQREAFEREGGCSPACQELVAVEQDLVGQQVTKLKLRAHQRVGHDCYDWHKRLATASKSLPNLSNSFLVTSAVRVLACF